MKSATQKSLSLLFTLIVMIHACATTSQGSAEAVSAQSEATLSAEDVRHFLSRTGLGVSPGQMQQYRSYTREQAVNTLLAEFSAVPSVPMPAWVDQPLPAYHARRDMSANEEAVFNNERDLELAQLKQWWVLEMLQTPSPQSERLVLFWHDVFATSYYDTDQQSLAMARQNETFHTKGMGSWGSLLKAMIRDPALLEFLDSGTNHKDSPNENLARELLELFTLGEGQYDELTVKEAARALTGHDTDRSHNLAFHLKTWQQDRNAKTLFGVSANHTGDDLIDLILQQDEAARFLSARFWSAFISDSQPDPTWLDQMANHFRHSNYEIKALYKAVLDSEAFWSDEYRGALIKSPVDLLVGTARSLEYPKAQWHQLAGWLGNLDMDLFAPPNVSGWSEGGAFVTPGRLLNRYKVIEQLVFSKTALMNQGGNMQMSPMMRSNDQRDSRLNVRLAAEDYKGPVKYQVVLYRSSQKIWQSLPTVFAYGHDTEEHGRLNDQSNNVWVTEAVAAPAAVLDAATRIDIAFLNDAAGPGGDRNLYVDGLELDDKWFSAAAAQQQSECEPNLAANSGRLYCRGAVSFNVKGNETQSKESQLDWSASAVHIEWANDEPERNSQVVSITLDNFKTPHKFFHNFQFSLVADNGEPLKLRLERMGCWPSCVTAWPACAWVDQHFTQRKTLVFPLLDESDPLWKSGQPLACHLLSLSTSDRHLVDSLWHSAEKLLNLSLGTQGGARFNRTLNKMIANLAAANPAPEASIYELPRANIIIDARFAPATPARARLVAQVPTVDNLEQLTASLASMSVSVHELLIPHFPNLAIDTLSLQEMTKHPAFQLK